MFSIHKKPKIRVEKYLLSLVMILTLSLFILPKKSEAFMSWDWIVEHINLLKKAEMLCNPTQYLFENIAEDQPMQSIVRFGYNYDTVRYLKIVYNIFGVSLDNILKCATTFPLTNMSALNSICALTVGSPSDLNCQNFILGYDYAHPEKFAESPVSGSFLGFYYTTEYAVAKMVNPTELNYFAYRTFDKVPFVGKALAAKGDINDVGAVTEAIYFAWKIVRDLSLGIFAILMLVIGIMMINRSKINPQTVVTIQYAIPKIVIALVLIAFSYPIGSFMTFASFNGAKVFKKTVIQLAKAEKKDFNTATYWKTDDATGEENFRIGPVIMQMFFGTFLFGGLGIVTVLISIVLILIILVQWLIASIRFIIYYCKMLVEIVLAPANFAVSAIPGNDDRVLDWFKRMLAYAIAMFVLKALPHLVFFMAVVVGASLSTNTDNFGNVLGLALLGLNPFVIGVGIAYVGMAAVLKLPKQIEEALTGVKKR